MSDFFTVDGFETFSGHGGSAKVSCRLPVRVTRVSRFASVSRYTLQAPPLLCHGSLALTTGLCAGQCLSLSNVDNNKSTVLHRKTVSLFRNAVLFILNAPF